MRIVLALLLVMVAVPVYAAEVALIDFDLETDHIDITTGFSGETLVVFGARHSPEGEVEIIVEGPRGDIIVREKERVMGAWMNQEAKTFKGIPIFYDVAMSGEVSDVEFPFLEGMSGTFKEGLVRSKKEEGLYPNVVSPVTFVGDSELFRVDFYLPPNVPIGDYTVMAVYKKGDFRQSQSKGFVVSKAGGSARVGYFAVHYPFVYGIGCVGFALFAGWFSNRVRRRT